MPTQEDKQFLLEKLEQGAKEASQWGHKIEAHTAFLSAIFDALAKESTEDLKEKYLSKKDINEANIVLVINLIRNVAYGESIPTEESNRIRDLFLNFFVFFKKDYEKNNNDLIFEIYSYSVRYYLELMQLINGYEDRN